MQPLAFRMRPSSIEEMIGHEEILKEGQPLRRFLEGTSSTSLILYGPPGSGKTAVASIASLDKNREFLELSAVMSGVKEVRAALSKAQKNSEKDLRTVLFIDEIHRFSKNQQDELLHAVENGTIILIAATTENPHFSVIRPLLSRSLLVTFERLTHDDISAVIERAIESQKGYDGKISIDEEAKEHLISCACGDARRALTYLESIADSVIGSGSETITIEDVKNLTATMVVHYDRGGSEHYDVTSAFIKSIRGSDSDAAIYYLARMIAGGEDPAYIGRRLVISAAEDIGLADPQALVVANAAVQSADMVGLPEARIILSEATIYLAEAPKSNSAYAAINAALKEVEKGFVLPVPSHLRDGHYSGAKEMGNSVGYKYPHDYAESIVEQQYLHPALKKREYYVPKSLGYEQTIAETHHEKRNLVRGE